MEKERRGVTEEGGEEKWLLWLAVLPAETGRAAHSTVVNGQPATKGKRRVKSSGKWRRIQCFLSHSHPPASLLGMSAMARPRGRRREWMRSSKSPSEPPPLHTHIETPTHTHTHITLSSLKQLSAGESDNKRNNTDRKCPAFLTWMGRWKGLSGYLCV